VIWYVEDLRRSKHEREALEALASTVDWLIPIQWRIDNSARLTYDADILIAGRKFAISLRYPNHFPHSPPVVLPREDTERWSSHQYGPGGELCLEYGPDNWQPAITGADMIVSAHRLLSGEAGPSGGTVPSRHETTLGQDLRGSVIRFLLTTPLAEFVSTIPEGAMLFADSIGTLHEETLVYIVASVDMPNGTKWKDPSASAPLVYEGYERRLAMIRWPDGAPLPSTESLTVFQADLTSCHIELENVRLALVAQKSHISAYLLTEDSDKVSELAVIPAPAHFDRLDQSHAILVDRKVGLVGCGSLGSKLAAMFARSGVGKFLLVDDDLLLPENLVRHDLDWRDIATHKVDSVARRIQLINPLASCQRRRHRLGGQESSGGAESLIEALANCDLIVDASANPAVFNYLCAAVDFGKKPLLWAEVFGGGFGGLIARHRPLLEPDPASMRCTIEAWCSERGKPTGPALADYGGGDDIPLIANDADVTVIASHAARMGIDILISRTPSMFPNSVYMIGLAEGWIFDRPFETYPIEVGQPAVSDSVPPIDSEEEKAEVARILELFAERKDAPPPAVQDNQTPSA
jgi:hypothetical protein